MRKQRGPAAMRLAGSLALVAATTAAGRWAGINASTAGFGYLVGVLVVAAGWGRAEAVTASVAAVLCYNFFFLPPVGLFTIADPHNWVALLAFLATALVGSHLSDRAKQEAAEARERQRETEQLYALSRAILLTDATQPVGAQAARRIAEIFECEAVGLLDAGTGAVYCGGPGEETGIDETLKRLALDGAERRGEGGMQAVAVTLGGKPIGALAIKGTTMPEGALRALANLVAIALERVRTEEAARRAEAARQSEEFKSTLLDAIAHEFKTPLTSIKAAATGLLSDSESQTAGQRELTAIIDEETNRLSRLVTEAVRMSQIDAGKVKLERRRLELRALMEGLKAELEGRLEGRAWSVDVGEGLPAVEADPELVALALRQLVDNSLKYSPPGAAIALRAQAAGDGIEIRVSDGGPGIPAQERERVFEKFYRRRGVRERVPGSGLGLYIAREIARAHGGELEIEDGEGGGAAFVLRLPAAREERR